ncbi:hypothetical protein EIQ04_17585 [Xanthomonas campestris pv. raphani]
MRDALTAPGTRRESVHGGSLAASMPPRVPDAVRAPRHPSWSLTDAGATPMRDASTHICIANKVLPATPIKRGRQPCCN